MRHRKKALALGILIPTLALAQVFGVPSRLQNLTVVNTLTANILDVTGAVDFSGSVDVTSPLDLNGTANTVMNINAGSAGVDEKLWQIVTVSNGLFALQTADDSGAFGFRPFRFDRTGTNVDSLELTTVSSVGITTDRLDLAVDALVTISDNLPTLNFHDTDAAANNGEWDFFANGGTFGFRLQNDARDSFANALTITRSGNTVTGFNVYADELSVTGDFSVTGIALVDGMNIATRTNSGPLSSAWNIGCGSASPSVMTFDYSVVYDHVAIELNTDYSCTASSAAMGTTAGAAPSVIRPSTGESCFGPVSATSGGTASQAHFCIQTDGSIDMKLCDSRGADCLQSNWATSGTRQVWATRGANTWAYKLK